MYQNIETDLALLQECELEGIAWEMQDLESKVGGLSQMYKLVDRLGEGELLLH